MGQPPPPPEQQDRQPQPELLGRPGVVEDIGTEILEDLLVRDPAAVAAWALEQVHALSRHSSDAPGSAVQGSPLFRLAGALRSAPLEQKQALVRSAVAGFGKLPAPERVEALRLAMQVTELAPQAQVPRSPREDSEAFASESGACGANSHATALAQHLWQAAEAAGLPQMPEEDAASLFRNAQAEAAAQLLQPQQLLDVLSILQPLEREQLAEKLVQTQSVPEEQQPFLKEAIRHGGHADKLNFVFKLLDKARKNAWVFFALPAVEFLLALILGGISCGTDLVQWLRTDSLLSLAVAGGLCLTARALIPAYDRLHADPIGTVQRWQTTHDLQNFGARLAKVIPGESADTFCYVRLGFICCALLWQISVIWAMDGALEMLGAALMGCNEMLVITTLIFVTLRLGTLAIAARLMYESCVACIVEKDARADAEETP